MTLSLNEIEATAKKAARGAGYPWGLAEEAAKATRWLCARDADGCGALAGLLERFDGKDVAGLLPQTDRGPWSARDGMLCPLATGAAISDLGHDVAANGIRTEAIAEPVLLVPFAALVARAFKEPVTVTAGDMALCTDGERMSSTGPAPHSSPGVSLCIGGTIDRPSKILERADPDPDAWAALLALAHRTYAPATEESRRKGAGAGLSDND